MNVNIEGVLEKYERVTRSDDFIKYEKDFALKLNSGLAKGYAENKKEPDLVKNIDEKTKELPALHGVADSIRFELSTKSVFIHGNKSQVKFDYYGQEAQRELGDLIFIVSVVFNGKKYLEKVTINQFKNELRDSKEIAWHLDKEAKEQLYLLSRFPTFERVKGVIPPRKTFANKLFQVFGFLWIAPSSR